MALIEGDILVGKLYGLCDENEVLHINIGTLQGIVDRMPIEQDRPHGEHEIIRCGQCKYAEVADSEDSQDGYTCKFHRGSIWFSGSYCSWAEREE